MTLHDRIRAAVEERLAIAREALGPERWRNTINGFVTVPGGFGGYDQVFTASSPAAGRHVAANDPADAILAAEHALGILERHAIVHRSIGWLRFDGNNFDECYGEIPVCGICVPKHSHFRTRAAVPEGPCDEIRSLATRWRVEVDG